MLKENRDRLKGAIGLMDQAIAPLTNAEIILGEEYIKEKNLLDGRIDIEEKEPNRFETLTKLNDRYRSIHAMVEYLKETKDFLEKL